MEVVKRAQAGCSRFMSHISSTTPTFSWSSTPAADMYSSELLLLHVALLVAFARLQPIPCTSRSDSSETHKTQEEEESACPRPFLHRLLTPLCTVRTLYTLRVGKLWPDLPLLPRIYSRRPLSDVDWTWPTMNPFNIMLESVALVQETGYVAF